MQLRQPDCAACPLNKRKKVYGSGGLDSKVLIVLEGPTEEDEREAAPMFGWSGQRVAALLQLAGLRRDQVRTELAYQCRESSTSALGKRAIASCGPSLNDVIVAMPNLEAIFTFGEAALQEVSGYRANEVRRKELEADVKACKKILDRAIKQGAKPSKRYKGPTLEAAQADLGEAYEAQASVSPVGWRGISDQRGSPRTIRVAGAVPSGSSGGLGLSGREADLEGDRSIWLFPLLHPSTTTPYKQPRLAPLLGIDFLKGVKLWRGELEIPSTAYDICRTSVELIKYLRGVIARSRSDLLGAIPVALDLEYSRQQRELVCIGIGPDNEDRYAIIPLVERGGWRMPVMERAGVFQILQDAFSNPDFAFGGHNTAGYDERKLRENGLVLISEWDTIPGFHLTFADFGSARDDDGEEDGRKFTQSSGYGLGFVSSMLTCLPFHKGVVTHDIDALSVDTDDLFTYCVGDVARTFHIWQALEEEFGTEWADPKAGIAAMQLEMECMRRAGRMTERGIPIKNLERLEQIQAKLAALEILSKEIRAAVGDEVFNVNSAPQLAKALKVIGVQVKYNPKTNAPKLAADQLDLLKQRHPNCTLIDQVLAYRKLEGDIEALEKMTPDRDGRWRLRWKIHGAVSRWSSTPNGQNLTEEQKGLVG